MKEIAKEILEKKIGYQVVDAKTMLEAIDMIEQQSQEVREKVECFLKENKEVGKKILEREAQWNTKKKK